MDFFVVCRLLWLLAQANYEFPKTILMNSFFEAYLNNPSEAIAEARKSAAAKSWCDDIDEDMIYAQLGSPEFRLYEQLI